MSRLVPTAGIAVLALASLSAWGWATAEPGDPTERAIRRALSEDPSTQVSGIRDLRELGEPGLDALLEAERDGRLDATPGQWTHAIDQVAAQRDARWSELFWHTDLERAKREARDTGKPILSLRMLGDLREATSCANSRFFRAVLYTHPGVRERLDDDFVLHWSSEREVPQLTIDFGDGREIHTTITGNSAHYVLDADGRPVDVLPGLVTPETFLAQLDTARDLLRELDRAPDRDEALREHHRQARDAAVARVKLSDRATSRMWLTSPEDIVLKGEILFEDPQDWWTQWDDIPPDRRVLAVSSIGLAVGKGMPENPIARRMMLGFSEPFRPQHIRPAMSGHLHDEARAFIQSQDPAGPFAGSRAIDVLIDRFEQSLALDSTWNRDVLHARVHQLFVEDPGADFASLNTRLYNRVFGTPSSDPWLGLYDPGVYTGLPYAGIVVRSDRSH